MADPYDPTDLIDPEDNAERTLEQDSIFAGPGFARTDRVGLQFLIDGAGSLGDRSSAVGVGLRPTRCQIIDGSLEPDDLKHQSRSR